MLKSALEYASKGWRVFPVAGKIPVTSNGVLAATTHYETLTAWWSPQVSWGIALATGGGIVVVDIDPKNDGPASLSELESKYGKLPETLRSTTPSGGSHYYYRSSNVVRNSASKLGDGIDIRGDGGYVVVPPSPGYAWDLGGLDEPAPIPEWVLLLLEQPKRNSVDVGGAVRFPDGQRNSSLASLAGTLRNRGASHSTILAALLSANADQCIPPLPEEEVEIIARSIASYEPSGTGRGTRGYRSGPSVLRGSLDTDRLPESGAFRKRNERTGVRVNSYYLRGRRRGR